MDKEKIEKFILKLIKATIDEEIEWTRVNYHPELINAKLVDNQYEGFFKEQRMIILSIVYDNYEPYLDRHYKSEGHILHLLDGEDNIEWEIFNTGDIGRLYNIAKYKSEKIDDKLDNLLSD